MNHIDKWVMGAASFFMALGGLFVASASGHGVGYWGGLAITVFCLWFAFHMIQLSFDHDEGH